MSDDMVSFILGCLVTVLISAIAVGIAMLVISNSNTTECYIDDDIIEITCCNNKCECE